MSTVTARRLRWKASAGVMRVLGRPAYEWLQLRWIARSIRTGRWRDDEVSLLRHLVREGETSIDVGANFGLYSFHLAKLVGRSGRVIAVEAVPSTAESLRRTLALLGVAERVEVIESGVSDSPGTPRCVRPERPDGRVARGVAWSLPPSANDSAGGSAGVRVRMERLDELVGSVDAAFVKIDTEGAEPFVIRGAEQLIARSAPT